MAVKDVFLPLFLGLGLGSPVPVLLLYFWLYSSKLVTNTAVDPYVAIKYKTKGFSHPTSPKRNVRKGRAEAGTRDHHRRRIKPGQ